MRVAEHPEDLYQAIHQTFLSPLLPQNSKKVLDKLLEKAKIFPPKSSNSNKIIELKQAKTNEEKEHLVPNVLFYNIDTHVKILQEMNLGR